MLGHFLFFRFLSSCHFYCGLQVCYLWKMLLDLRFVLFDSTHWLWLQSNFINDFFYSFLLFSWLLPWLQTSDTHAKLIEILEKTNFITQEFILTPLQFGIPYSRPRYFCLVGFLYPWCILFIWNVNGCFKRFLDALYIIEESTGNRQICFGVWSSVIFYNCAYFFNVLEIEIEVL